MAEPPPVVPPPVEQLAANCASPTYASDMTVCGAPELLALDTAMRSGLAEAGIAATGPASPMIEDQAGWFRRRSLCAMKPGQAACLRAAYGERIAVLNGLSGKADMSGPGFDCTANGNLDKARVILGADGSAIIYRSADVIAIGQWRFDAKVWRPFIAIRASGRRLTVAAPDGNSARCRKVAA